MMEIFSIKNDIKVVCIKAKKFPEGIQEAHQKLHALIPFSEKRMYFGISFPLSKDKIEYKTAASELFEGELNKYHLEEFTIKNGNYLHIDIPDYMKNIPSIAGAFRKILQDKRIDPNGCCVEWYLSESVCRCMVRIIK